MKKPLLFVLLCFLLGPGYGQEAAEMPPEDLKVGLVLSGGGAKGLAHIGDLKVIEEAGVRIDYIGGTSMGAIIGALYASGYKAAALDSIFKTVDFDMLIQDHLPRSAKTFQEKENEDRYALTLPFDGFKISFPPAISKGQNVYDLLVKLLYHVNHINDFNRLPVPFLCIATDVETGMPVVLNKGYLPEAIAASGAFPSLFEPIEIEGKVLIDGGVANNYPVDEVKALGADIIIGVDVQDDLADRNALKSAPEILVQVNNYRTVNDMKQKSKKTDLYIKPDITEFTVISFEDGARIIGNGETGARKKLGELREIAARQQAAPAKRAVAEKDSIVISSVDIKGNKYHSRAYVMGKLRFNTKKNIPFEKLQQGIGNLSATNNFEAIRYKIIPGEQGEKLQLSLREKANTTFLKLAIHYDNLYKSAALFNITTQRALTSDDFVSLDVALGDNVRYNFDYYIDKGRYWSFGLKSRYNTFSKAVSAGIAQVISGMDIPVNKLDIEVEDLTNQIYLQTVFREAFSLRMGAEHKRLDIASETVAEEGFEGTTFEKSNFISAFGKLILDTYDNKYFPCRGVYFNGDFHWYLYSSDYTGQFSRFSIAKATFGFATPVIRRITFNFATEGGFKLGSTGLSSLDFFLGGYGNQLINNFIPFPGYDFLSLSGDSYVKALGKIDYEFVPKNHLHFTVNYANVANDIFDTGEWLTAPDFSGYSLGYSLESFIGPIEARYSWSPERGSGMWFVNLGFWF
ncbi:MAG: patatin-like phospholipase family protein [Sinomicrobium sp.]|nr:patatin-like phospholipase family protein [Sinomicrobium sp.]